MAFFHFPTLFQACDVLFFLPSTMGKRFTVPDDNGNVEPLDVARFVIGIVFLMMASVTDIRTRKVPNALWAGVMPSALAILALDLVVQDMYVELLTIPMVLFLLLPVFFEGGESTDLEKGLLATPLWIAAGVISLVSAGALYALGGDPVMFLIPGLILLVYGMYVVGLLFGGGDAKAMIALVLLVPFHPDVWTSLLSTPDVLPFPITVLMDAMLLFLVIPVGIAVFNITRGDLGFPEMFFGYRMDTSDVARNHVWPMEKVVNMQRVMVLFPSRSSADENLSSLRKAGVDRIWVAPKIPFMIPLLMGFVAAFIIGDLMIAYVAWLVP